MLFRSPNLCERLIEALSSAFSVRAIGHVEDLDIHDDTVEVPAHWKVKGMLIGEVARRSGVPAKTLRYYEDIGLLSADRTRSGYRDYRGDILERLAFIRSAQAVGLTLGEIRGIVALRDGGHAPCGHVLELLRARSEEIARTIRDLRVLQGELKGLVERAQGLDPADCDPERICHLIGPT